MLKQQNSKDIHLTEKEIEKMQPFRNFNNGIQLRGIIYRKGDKFYKIYNDDITELEEKIIDELLELKKNQNYLSAENKIFIDNKSRGYTYTFPFKENIQTLIQVLKDKNIKFETRILESKKFLKIVKELYKEGIVNSEINLNGVIRIGENYEKENEIILDNMHSCSFKNILLKEEFEKQVRETKFRYILLVLSYIYEIDFFPFNDNNKDLESIINGLPLDKKIKSIAEDLINEKNIENISVTNYLETLKEENVKNDSDNLEKFLVKNRDCL